MSFAVAKSTEALMDSEVLGLKGEKQNNIRAGSPISAPPAATLAVIFLVLISGSAVVGVVPMHSS